MAAPILPECSAFLSRFIPPGCSNFLRSLVASFWAALVTPFFGCGFFLFHNILLLGSMTGALVLYSSALPRPQNRHNPRLTLDVPRLPLLSPASPCFGLQPPPRSVASQSQFWTPVLGRIVMIYFGVCYRNFPRLVVVISDFIRVCQRSRSTVHGEMHLSCVPHTLPSF